MINPRAEVVIGAGESTATLAFEIDATRMTRWRPPRGWNIDVGTGCPKSKTCRLTPAALLAATVGVAELFRRPSAAELGAVAGTGGSQPGAFNPVPLGEPTDGLPVPERSFRSRNSVWSAQARSPKQRPTARLLSGVSGTMLAVDPEAVALSNLQRYVLTGEGDVGALKVDPLARAAREIGDRSRADRD